MIARKILFRPSGTGQWGAGRKALRDPRPDNIIYLVLSRELTQMMGQSRYKVGKGGKSTEHDLDCSKSFTGSVEIAKVQCGTTGKKKIALVVVALTTLWGGECR